MARLSCQEPCDSQLYRPTRIATWLPRQGVLWDFVLMMVRLLFDLLLRLVHSISFECEFELSSNCVGVFPPVLCGPGPGP